MIRINLLPAQEVSSKLELYDQLRMGIIALIAVVAVIGFLAWDIRGKISTRKEGLNKLQTELNRLNQAGVEKKLKEFEQSMMELETKIDVIWQKKSEQAGPVHLLDGVSRSLPDRVWLSSLDQNPKGVAIRGFAYTNVDVAQFMANLEASDYFSDVQLVQSIQGDVEGHKVMDFTMKFKYDQPKGWGPEEKKQ